MNLFDHLPESAILLDSDGVILRCNREAEREFGISTAQHSGSSFPALLDGAELDSFIAFFKTLRSEDALTHCTSLKGLGEQPTPVTIQAKKTDTAQFILLLRKKDPRSTKCGGFCARGAILEAQYQNNPGGILLVNSQMEMISFNREFVRIWDIPEEVQQSRNEEESLKSVLSKMKQPEEFLNRVRQLYDHPKETSTDEIELRDGRILLRHTYPVSLNDDYLGRVWYFLDITPLKNAQKQVGTQQGLQQAILHHIRDGIIACDNDEKLSLFNQASLKLLKNTEKEVLPATVSELQFHDEKTGELLEEEQNPLIRILKGETLRNLETVLVDGDNRKRCLRVSGQAMNDIDGSPMGGVISMHDITDLNRIKERLRFMAYHDELTGLPNRRLFHDLLQQSLKQAHRNKQEIGVLFLDLDNFKRVNDLYGHDHGDKLLKEVARLLQGRLRDSDILCRWGGDEFVIGLLECDGIDGVINVAEKICLQLTGSMGDDADKAHVTLSIGIALYPQHGSDADRLIRNADVAMYRAKRSGKNRCELFLSKTT